MFSVAHIVRRFSFDAWGGSENVIWNTVLSQRNRGVNAEILTTSALSVPGDEICQGVQIRRFHYWYPYFPMPPKVRQILDQKGGSLFAPALFQTLRRNDYDMVHVHCTGRMAQVCVGMAYKQKIPCVISLHGGNMELSKMEIMRMLKPVKWKFYYGGAVDRLLKIRGDALARADAVICSGRNEEAALKEKYPHQRILYLPNGIDNESFYRKTQMSARREWKIPSGCILILCIAPITYQKNQMILLRLLADEPGTHLLLIGPVVSVRYYQEILTQAETLNISSRLTVIPGLPEKGARLKAILHEADVLVIPAEHEPSSTVVLEAMAAGIPIIASNAGGVKELIVNNRNGLLFPSGHYEALRMAYEKLSYDAGLRETLVQQAGQDVRKYSWDALMEKLLRFYRELIRVKN